MSKKKNMRDSLRRFEYPTVKTFQDLVEQLEQVVWGDLDEDQFQLDSKYTDNNIRRFKGILANIPVGVADTCTQEFVLASIITHFMFLGSSEEQYTTFNEYAEIAGLPS